MSSSGRQWRHFGRFNLVGLLGAALQLLLLHVLTKCFHVPGIGATPLAVEIVVLHNFMWHERFTWRDRQPKRARQVIIRLVRFHAGNGFISLLGNTVLTYWLVDRLKAPLLPSALGAIAVCAVANFLIADRWVYAPTRS